MFHTVKNSFSRSRYRLNTYSPHTSPADMVEGASMSQPPVTPRCTMRATTAPAAFCRT